MGDNLKVGNKVMSFFRRQDWEGFLMGFISVFLGIVLTFGGEAMISNHNEKQDVRNVLILVRDELNTNIEMITDVDEELKKQKDAAVYLMRYYDNFEACDKDSMRMYCNLPLSTISINSSKEALELLKTSALFQKIRDKELSLNIIKAYNRLQVVKESVDFYNEKLSKLIASALQEEAKAVFASANFTAVEMWNALTSTDEGRQFLYEIKISVTFGMGTEETVEVLQAVVDEINNYIE